MSAATVSSPTTTSTAMCPRGCPTRPRLSSAAHPRPPLRASHAERCVSVFCFALCPRTRSAFRPLFRCSASPFAEGLPASWSARLIVMCHRNSRALGAIFSCSHPLKNRGRSRRAATRNSSRDDRRWYYYLPSAAHRTKGPLRGLWDSPPLRRIMILDGSIRHSRSCWRSRRRRMISWAAPNLLGQGKAMPLGGSRRRCSCGVRRRWRWRGAWRSAKVMEGLCSPAGACGERAEIQLATDARGNETAGSSCRRFVFSRW